MNRTCPTTAWPLERALFAMAGTVTLLSAALEAEAWPWSLLLTAFVGVNLPTARCGAPYVGRRTA